MVNFCMQLLLAYMELKTVTALYKEKLRHWIALKEILEESTDPDERRILSAMETVANNDEIKLYRKRKDLETRQFHILRYFK